MLRGLLLQGLVGAGVPSALVPREDDDPIKVVGTFRVATQGVAGHDPEGSIAPGSQWDRCVMQVVRSWVYTTYRRIEQ